MTRVIVLLSGPIAAGKTILCEELVGRFGFTVFKTRELIQQLMQQVPSERGALQKAGESLDNKTKGEWIANSLAQKAQEMGATGNIVIDSVRIKKQIDGVRRAFGVHVHLRADDRVLESVTTPVGAGLGSKSCLLMTRHEKILPRGVSTASKRIPSC
jgi:adenylosuccinate synthase